MTLFRYFTERGGPETEHRGLLHWPGTVEGFPFRGPTSPHLTQKESDEIESVLDFHSDLFDLSVADRKKQYDTIKERIANGWYMLVKEREKWLDSWDAPRIWLEWYQIYGELPTGKHPGGTHDGGILSRLPQAPAAQLQQSEVNRLR